MRLNRVLQLTAAVTIAMVASIFTISCGEDGAAGNDGTGCTISGSGVPYTVTCSGVEVGLLNGEDGETGPVGPQGQQGKSCSLTPSGASYTVSCGGALQGTLGGCSATKTDSLGREATITCGPTKISLCNNQVFEPTTHSCTSIGTLSEVAYCGGEGEEDSELGVAYNRTKQYCGFKDSLAFKAGTPTVMDLCYNSVSGTVFSDHGDNSPNAAAYNATDKKWVLGTFGTPAGGNSDKWYAPTSALSWKGQYCMVLLARTVSGTGANAKIVEVKETATPGITPVPGGDHTYDVGDSTAFCNGKIEKFNENTWQGEYCGYASATAKSRSKVKTACGNGDMPNENSWEEGYCAISLDPDNQYLTFMSTDYCGPTLRITGTGNREAYEVVRSKKVKINANTATGLLPAGSYKGEYCGYNIADFRKTIGGNTSNNTISKKVSVIDTQDTVMTVAGTYNAASDTLFLSKLTGACTYTPGKTIFNIGPNARDAYNFNLTSTSTPAFASGVRIWLAQYCQGYDPDHEKYTRPAPTSLPTYLNFEAFCTVDSASVFVQGRKSEIDAAGVTGATSALAAVQPDVGDAPTGRLPGILSQKASAKVNEGSWKGQYCYYESAAKFAKTASVSKPNAICDDTQKPNEAIASNYNNHSGDYTDGNYWKNEFCAPNGGTTQKVGITLTNGGAGDNWRMYNLFDVFCPSDTNFSSANAGSARSAAYLAKLQTLKKANMLDSNSSVKKEYCGFSSKSNFENKITSDQPWSYTNANPKFTKLTTICGNGGTPNAAGEDLEGASKVVGNPPVDAASNISGYAYWKNEYCQYNYAAGETQVAGIELEAASCGGGLNCIRDPHILTKFCPSDTAFTVVTPTGGTQDYGNASYLTKFQASGVSTLNKGSNLKQYCGFSSKSNLENETSATGTTEQSGSATGKVKRPKFSVLTTRCSSDNKGINQAMDDASPYATTTSWNNDYCQAIDDDRGRTKRVGGFGAYCGDDIDWTKPATFAPMNKDTWKGEYCFDDYKVGKCYGGQIPATGSVSTDPDDKRCSPF